MNRRAETMRRLNADPEFRKKRLEKLALVNSDPAFQEKRMGRLKEYFAKPEVKMLRGEKMRQRWKDKNFRKKMLKAWQTPKARAKRSESLKRTLSVVGKTPEYRKMRSEITKRYYADPKNNPLAAFNEIQLKEYKRLRKCGAPKDEAIRKAKRKHL